MLNTVYQLKRPRQFEIVFKNVDLDEKHVLVRPTYLSICNADQRYYQGLRDKEILKEKLPMALIHEGIGRVVYDPTGTFSAGDNVIIIPNIPTEEDEIIGENYLYSSRFCSSSEDGFLREFVSARPDRLISLPEGINPDVAAFTELVSVGYHAIERFDRTAHQRRDVIGIWGDGNLSFITSLLLKKRFPDSRVYVFGKHRQKMADFTFADRTFEITEIPEEIEVDHAFECVGSQAAQLAIDQIIGCLNPQGVISLFGVSEYQIPINTRLVLEKGLAIIGNSRSGREDFIEVISLLQDNSNLFKYLSNLIIDTIEINSLNDLKEAFNRDHISNFGKIVLKWDK